MWVARWRDATGSILSAPAGADLQEPRSQGTSVLVQLQRDQLRDAGLLHGDAVEPVGDLHGLAVVRDQDELRLVLHAAEHLDEAPDVGVVERRVDLVEQAERR